MPASHSVPPRYSIVVPFHDEQDSVRELHQRLSEVMTGRYDPVEFVYVDDQSSDATPQILAALAEEDPRVAVLRLKRNYGQTTALAAGFDFASGDIIVSIDVYKRQPRHVSRAFGLPLEGKSAIRQGIPAHHQDHPSSFRQIESRGEVPAQLRRPRNHRVAHRPRLRGLPHLDLRLRQAAAKKREVKTSLAVQPPSSALIRQNVKKPARARVLDT